MTTNNSASAAFTFIGPLRAPASQARRKVRFAGNPTEGTQRFGEHPGVPTSQSTEFTGTPRESSGPWAETTFRNQFGEGPGFR